LDSFDINNDGKVTSKEYEAAVKKYGAPDVDDPDVTRDEIVYAAKDASKNSGLTLKKAIATCDFNENNAIPIQTLNRNIRNKIGYDHQQANELINLIREGEEPEITAEEIFTFYDEKLADDPNIDLEIKIILNRIEIEQSESIIKYLVRECGFEADKDLLLKLFWSNLDEVFQIKKSSSKHIYDELKLIRENIINPNLNDFYILLLERRDLEKLRTETTNVQAIKGKIEKYLTSKFDKDLSKALSKIGEENDVVISAKADKDMTKFVEFLEIFWDKHRVITPKEAETIFNDINSTQKIPDNPPHIKISGRVIFNYFWGSK
jgi:hypothetical protein